MLEWKIVTLVVSLSALAQSVSLLHSDGEGRVRLPLIEDEHSVTESQVQGEAQKQNSQRKKGRTEAQSRERMHPILDLKRVPNNNQRSEVTQIDRKFTPPQNIPALQLAALKVEEPRVVISDEGDGQREIAREKAEVEAQNESISHKSSALSPRSQSQKQGSKSNWWVYGIIMVSLLGSGWCIFRWVRQLLQVKQVSVQGDHPTQQIEMLAKN